jgi:hypothetical protein
MTGRGARAYTPGATAVTITSVAGECQRSLPRSQQSHLNTGGWALRSGRIPAHPCPHAPFPLFSSTARDAEAAEAHSFSPDFNVRSPFALDRPGLSASPEPQVIASARKLTQIRRTELGSSGDLLGWCRTRRRIRTSEHALHGVSDFRRHCALPTTNREPQWFGTLVTLFSLATPWALLRTEDALGPRN